MTDHDHARSDLDLRVSDSPDGRADTTTFEPARLTQARILAELTKAELAELMGVPSAMIAHYEAGITPPSPETMAVLARSLSVPIGYFTAGRPLARLDSANIHFRSLRSIGVKERAKAAAHAELLWELIFALERRVRFPDRDLPRLPEGTSPADAAHRLRKEWGIDRGPVPHLGATMESHGIVIGLIPPTNSSVTRVSAYSTDALDRPLVIITPERTRSVYRYRFTCAHELGHLLLHPNPLPGDRRQEREADQFAAELLTPRNEIEPLLPSSVRIVELERLSKQWGVSVESLLYRMGELGMVNDSALRVAHQRLADRDGSTPDEPMTSYAGEVPGLLREAVDAATRQGFDRSAMASELRWTEYHLLEILGESDGRPQLSLVR